MILGWSTESNTGFKIGWWFVNLTVVALLGSGCPGKWFMRVWTSHMMEAANHSKAVWKDDAWALLGQILNKARYVYSSWDGWIYIRYFVKRLPLSSTRFTISYIKGLK